MPACVLTQLPSILLAASCSCTGWAKSPYLFILILL